MRAARAARGVWRSKLRRALLPTGLVAALTCVGGAPEGSEPGVLRLMRGEVGGELQPGSLGEEIVVFDGLIGDGGWMPVAPLAAWRFDGESLIVESGAPSFDLERQVDLDAAELHSLVVTMASGYKVGLTLGWRQAGDTEWAADGLSLNYDDGRGEPHDRTFTFDLSSEARWAGPIGRLRLRFEPARQGDRIVIKRLRGVQRRVSRQTLAEWSRSPWEVELGREVRRVLVVPPGNPVERDVRVPPDSSLVFAVGASGRLSVPVTFRITAVDSGGRDETLFETVIEPTRRTGTRQWREAVVDLGRLAGERLLLRAESLAGDGFDPILGVPVWASPEIVPEHRPNGQPNIVLISVDTLRADHLSLYGYPQTTSPNIDHWAARHAVVFKNTVAQAPWTLPSHSSMLTGLDALHHGVNHPFEAAPQELETLAELLWREGYVTAGVTGGGWLHPGYGLAGGYDRYRYWIGARRGDEELETHVRVASALLEQLREPFFLFLHSYDVHDFNAPGRMEPRVGEDPSAHAARHYDQAVKHMDEQLGLFLARFAASGLRGRTVLALTSDHGEDLGEDEVFGHGSLRDPVLLVPLVLELPNGRGAGRRIEAQVRSVDMVPTLLELAGVEIPAGLDGVSLLGLIDGAAESVPPMATSYFALEHGLALRFANRWKFLYDNSVWKTDGQREALFRLPGGESRDRDDRAAESSRINTLRALAGRLLEERLAGLRLRLENGLSAPFVGTLRGELVDAGVPRSPNPAGAWLRRTADGRAEFALPPGQRLELLFEHVGEPHFEIEPAAAGVPLAIDLETLDLPATFHWAGGSWQRAVAGDAVGDAAAATVSIEWHLGAGPGAAPPFTADADLRRQLEALGYLH